jgi:hypothetical protein
MKVELNGFEVFLIKEGLKTVREQMKQDIRDIELEGKNSIMTEGYVDMICDELESKLKLVNLQDVEVEF